MRVRPVPYLLFLLYELFRLYILMEHGFDSFLAPLSWYASVPLLILTPVLLLMLTLEEDSHRYWLPLITLLKAITIPSLLLFVAETIPAALRFGAGDNGMLVKSVVTAVFFILGDAIIGVYCFGRNRILCR